MLYIVALFIIPTPEIRGSLVSKIFFWPFGPQFSVVIGVGGGGGYNVISLAN